MDVWNPIPINLNGSFHFHVFRGFLFSLCGPLLDTIFNGHVDEWIEIRSDSIDCTAGN